MGDCHHFPFIKSVVCLGWLFLIYFFNFFNILGVVYNGIFNGGIRGFEE